MLTMHLRNETSDALVHALANSGTSDRKQLQTMMEHAKAVKPVVDGIHFDKHHKMLAQLYANNQEGLTREELKVAFPKTWQRMAIETHGIVKRLAVEEGTAYETPPERWLTFDGKRYADEVTDADEQTSDPRHGERQQQLTDAIEAARMHRAMLEAGRRVVVAQTCFVRLGWRKPVEGRAAVGNKGRAVLDVYWPHQVQVACHHSAPDDLYSAYLLIAVAPGPGGGEWAEVWRREVYEENGVLTGFGPWRAERIPVGDDRDDKDQRYAVPLFDDGEYPLPTLPWVVLHDGVPTHGVYVDEGRDLVRVNLNINRVSSDDLYGLAQGAHRQVYIQSDRLRKDGTDVVWGPGEALLLESGDTAGALPPAVTSAGREHREQRLRSLAVERRLPPHRFDTETTTVESGLAKQVQDIPATKARREREELYTDIEEECLLPILAEISDYWGHTNILHAKRTGIGPGVRLDDVAFHVSFSGVSEYESKEAKERYAAALLDRKAVTLARYAVLADAYATIEEAEAQGLSNEIQQAAPSPVGGEGLAAFTAGLQGLAVEPDDAEEVTEDDNA